jgi:hypothetical protein
MSDLTMKDLNYEKIIENYNKVEVLEKRFDDFENKMMPLINKLSNFVENINSKIDERVKLYMANINNNSIEKVQDNLIETKKIKNNEIEKKEEVHEKKLDILKFVEVFSQEFDFINKDQFNEEMENDEIMDKIIELIKRMLGIKDNEIESKKMKIDGLEIKKTQLENDIQGLNLKINEKEKKNNNLEKNKIELEEKIENLNYKVNKIETLKNNLEDNIKQLNNEKKKLEDDLENKKKQIIRLEEVERNLENKNSELIKDKEELNKENREKDEKLKKFMKLFEEKKQELISIGNLLEARKLYDKYLSMETRILSKLENVLIQRDFESFISSGYTLSSLDNIWDIVKIEYKNISNGDKEILKEIFSFFLSQINKRFKKSKYGLVEVEIGEDFDAVNQVDLSQNSRGRVTECVFYGYGFLSEKENSDNEPVVERIIKSPLVLTI